jgi:hypothetical protein
MRADASAFVLFGFSVEEDRSRRRSSDCGFGGEVTDG